VVTKEKFPRFNYEDRSFENFVDFVAENIDLERGNVHLRLQSTMIDFNRIDYLGRFENYADNLKEVMGTLGIETEIPRKNASDKGDYRQYYTKKTKDKVASLYRKDIRLFNYDF